MKSKSGTVFVMLVVAMFVIVLMSMLATHMAGWSAWALLGVAGVAVLLIFSGIITMDVNIQLLLGLIGSITVIIAAIIKLVR